MEKWELWLLIFVVLAFIASNLIVLKHTAHFKLPPFLGKPKVTPEQKKTQEQRQKEQKAWDNDDWDKDNWDDSDDWGKKP